jgi:hypothetical protein
MVQKILGDWNDWLILILLIYLNLVFFRVIEYPSKNLEIKYETLKKTKRGTFLKIVLPLLVVIFLIKAILAVYK